MNFREQLYDIVDNHPNRLNEIKSNKDYLIKFQDVILEIKDVLMKAAKNGKRSVDVTKYGTPLIMAVVKEIGGDYDIRKLYDSSGYDTGSYSKYIYF